MVVRPVQPGDRDSIVPLIAGLRVDLARLRGRTREADLRAAAEEFDEFVRKGAPIFLAEDGGSGVVGYLVCRVEGDVVWAEQLYVSQACRREGIGTALFAQAERLAEEHGGGTVYTWIHPNNHRVISFLGKRGYSVLNLVEVRRPREGETPAGKIRVGDHAFDY